MAGGGLPGHLMQSGWPLGRAREFAMAMAAPFVPTAGFVVAATWAIPFGHGMWVANLQTIPTDLFHPSEVRGHRFSGMALGGVLANLGTGHVARHFSYAPLFCWSG